MLPFQEWRARLSGRIARVGFRSELTLSGTKAERRWPNILCDRPEGLESWSNMTKDLGCDACEYVCVCFACEIVHRVSPRVSLSQHHPAAATIRVHK